MPIVNHLHNLQIAIEALRANPMRSLLTALGIIFGVAAVISMLAIGAGAKQEILRQMEMVGVNNILISPESPNDSPNEERDSEEEQPDKPTVKSPGLTLEDYKALRAELPSVRYASPIVQYNTTARYDRELQPVLFLGVSEEYFRIYHLALSQGRYFSSPEAANGNPVCVVGENVRSHLFSPQNPIGKRLQIRDVWFEVVGVIAPQEGVASIDPSLGVRDANSAIIVPYHTLNMRYANRTRIVQHGRGLSVNAKLEQQDLDGVVVQVYEPQQLVPTQDVLQRLLARTHHGAKDFKVIVPEQLLRQQQRTKDIFNFVLGAIAGISLIVGGIGIMNIMFATVLERTREIGLRLAIGGKRVDIALQFLAEAVLISVTGGVIGVFLGVGLSYAVSHFAEISTVITGYSVGIAFIVSVSVGILFGYAPARRAARRSPIESLRHE